MSDAVDDPIDPEPSDRPDGVPDTASASAGLDREGATVGEIDVARIEADLDAVQAALGRLADGTYWTDEVTGEPIPPEVLAADPLARRA